MLKEAQTAITSMATSTTALAIPNMVTLKTAAITTATRVVRPVAVVEDPRMEEILAEATTMAAIAVRL